MQSAYLARRHTRATQHLILVTAFTNTAVHNLLSAIASLFPLWRKMMEREATKSYLRDTLGESSADESASGAEGEEQWAVPVELVHLMSSDTPEEVLGPLMQRAEGVMYTTKYVPKNKWSIVAGTVWQLHKHRAKLSGAQVLVVDEGSQLPLVDASLAIDLLDARQYRLLVAGDPLQLPPILQGRYPADKRGPVLHGSVLHGLLRDRDNQPIIDIYAASDVEQCPLVARLVHNRRSNRAISDFTASLYGITYQPALENRLLRLLRPRVALEEENNARNSGLLFDVLHSQLPEHPQPSSLVTVVVDAAGEGSSDTLLHALVDPLVERCIEAEVVRVLVKELRQWARQDTTCFIVTPHRSQRTAIQSVLQLNMDGQGSVQAAMEGKGKETEKEKEKETGEESGSGGRSQVGEEVDESKSGMRIMSVDTVERVQGQQADVVMVAMALQDADVVGRETDFLFSLPRLNVAFSRARRLCILLVSSVVLEPNGEVLASRAASAGYAHLLKFVNASTRVNCKFVPLEKDSGKGGLGVGQGGEWRIEMHNGEILKERWSPGGVVDE